MFELPWVAEARKWIGLHESMSGEKVNANIAHMLEVMGRFTEEDRAGWHDDKTPWCGLFAGYCLGVSDRFVVKHWYRAGEWNDVTMTKLDVPYYGCVVTFKRQGGGHVGFVVGEDERGNLMVLGGNQADSVCVAPFKRERATGFYWPSEHRGALPIKIPADPIYRTLPRLRDNGSIEVTTA